MSQPSYTQPLGIGEIRAIATGNSLEIVCDEHPALKEGEVYALVQEWKKNPEGQRGCLN